jgi:hypothetical protein
MTKVKVSKKKGQTPRSEGQGHGIKWKVLPEWIHMWNRKVLAPTNQVITKVKVFADRRTDRRMDRHIDYDRVPTISGALKSLL